MVIVSPAQWNKVKDWRTFAEQPSGTGPFRVTKFVPRERLELDANKNYWDAKRRPKIDKLVLLPMPEPTTRLAALRSGQVDWVEVRPRASTPQPKGAGFQTTQTPYPQNGPHTLRLDKERWNSKLVRKAANYAIDRVGICKGLLNDTCIPATGIVYKGHPWFGKPKETYSYNPAKAKELLRQAGFDASKHPAKAVHLISTSGSGQMLPLAMNELIQKNLKDVGLDVDLQPVEWNTLLTRWRAGFHTSDNEGLNAWNISWNFLEPWSGFGRFFHSKSVVPVAVNTMPYINPEADKLIEEAERTFDVGKQNETLAKLHEIIVDDAPWIFIVHDQNPRALSAKVKGALGRRIATRRAVILDVRDALANSLVLALSSSLLAFALGVALGLLAAFRQGRALDKLASAIAVVGVSVPHYWAGIILIIIFSVQLNWLPAMGAANEPGVLPYLRHIALPTVALSLIPLGVITRVVRSAALDILSQEFVLALRAKGLAARRVFTHVVKNAAPPIPTVLGAPFGL